VVSVKIIGDIQLGLGLAIIIFTLIGTIITIHNAKNELDQTLITTKNDFDKNVNMFLDRYEDINQKYNLTTEETSQKTITLLFNTANMRYSYENFTTNMRYSYNNFVYIIFAIAVILIILAIMLILEGLSDVKIEEEFEYVEEEIKEEKGKIKSETYKI
jgi:hypothetical protein